MNSIRGVISAVQEGRFLLIADDGRTIHFVLSHKAGLEPQDLPKIEAEGRPVRVSYRDGSKLIAAAASEIDVEE